MNTYDHISKRFQTETATHKMTVLHDDGLYRHLRFAPEKGPSFYWFDLVTWPGTLAFRGDVDGYMFTRVPDMFEFFRMHRTPRNGHLEINPGYWSEKVEGGEGATKTYSEDRFRQLVIEYFVDVVRAGNAPRGLGKAIRAKVLNADEAAYEDGARQILDGFTYGEVYVARCLTSKCRQSSRARQDRAEAQRWTDAHTAELPGHSCYVFTEPAFTFADAWEWDLRDYDWSFLWACHAIVWGIAQYDAHKAEAVSLPAGAVAS